MEKGNITVIHIHEYDHSYSQKPTKYDGHKSNEVMLELIQSNFIASRKG